MLYYQDLLINIILSLSSNRVINFLGVALPNLFFLLLSILLVNFKPDALIWQGLYIFSILLLLIIVMSKAKN